MNTIGVDAEKVGSRPTLYWAVGCAAAVVVVGLLAAGSMFSRIDPTAAVGGNPPVATIVPVALEIEIEHDPIVPAPVIDSHRHVFAGDGNGGYYAGRPRR
jgi:hypothetical protein